MIKAKKKNSIVLKNQIVNSFMSNGKKTIGEKILLKLSKSLQKSIKKPLKFLVQLAIINTTPVFKLNEQIMKKGKRKSKKFIPSFLIKDSRRIMTAIKFIKDAVSKDKSSINFYKKVQKEILASSLLKSLSIEQKIASQNQVLLNKRYLSKFRW